jgi:adenine-specific DNA-methyltransferase
MNKIKENLYSLLKKDSRFWDEETKELNETLFKDLIDKLDEKLIDLLLSNKETKEKFFIKINDVYVLKQNDLKFFIDENKLDNSYTQYQNKIGLRVGNKLLSEITEKDVILEWPFKDCVLEGGMTKEDQKRNEIFFNEVLAKDEIDRLFDPKALVNWKRHTIKGEEKVKELKCDKNGTIRENLIIKSNNLLALHTLKEKFTGKVKLIYIDPPYNIDGDGFNYNDNFNESTWLTFMKNRLEIARELLSEEGTIIIQIDDNEFAQLKLLAGEVFKTAPSGKSNFVQIIEVKTNVGAANEYQNPFMPKNCEYLLIFAKNYDKRAYKPEWIKSDIDRNYKYFVENPKDESENWIISSAKEIFTKLYSTEEWDKEDIVYNFYIKNINNIFRTISPKGPGKKLKEALNNSKNNKITEYKREDGERVVCYNGELVRFYLKNIKKDIDGKLIISRELGSLWTDIPWTGIAKEGGVKLKKGKKPEKLLRRIIEMSTEPGEIVMDYHLGSGTTCAVAHKMGRQYIGIEQLDYKQNGSVIRLNNVIKGDKTGVSKSVKWQGGGDFVYIELAKWNKEAKEKILKAKTLSELEKLFNKLYEKYFLNYNVKTKEFKEKFIKEEGFKNLSLNDQKRLFIEMLDMNQMYVNFSERADKKYNLSQEDIALSEEFYNKK